LWQQAESMEDRPMAKVVAMEEMYLIYRPSETT
jgi:hypothetical protein